MCAAADNGPPVRPGSHDSCQQHIGDIYRLLQWSPRPELPDWHKLQRLHSHRGPKSGWPAVISGSIQTVAKISANNGNVPGNAVATLTNPTSLLGDSLNTFTAPAGTTLEPSTTYWVVVNDGLPGGDTWQYALTPGNGQTGETGWEIADQRLFRTSGTNWTQSTNSLSIAIKGTINAPPPSQEALTPNQVVYIPLDWSLKPAGIGPGERFRLIFLSSTKRNATSSDIETYNTFVQNQAAAGHANIQDHASRFKVVGCTEDIDARDNTGTTHQRPRRADLLGGRQQSRR